MRTKERIPLHDHVDNNSGGPLSGSTLVIAGGGSTAPSGGGITVHEFAGPLHTTTETDTSKVAHPDGTGGVVWGVDAGGAEPAFDHGSMGATETVDIADGTWHRGTLNADCTITVTGFTVDEGLVVVFEVTQDGTGGWAITWDPDVVFVGDDQPDQTASATTVFLLFSSAGDSLIYGAKVGAGSTVAALDDLTDVTITTPAENDTLRYISGEWVNDNRRWEPVTTNPGTGPELVWDGDSLVMNWTAY